MADSKETIEEIMANRLVIIGQTLIRIEALLEKMAEESAEQTRYLTNIFITLDQSK